jgi:hypothetical protein
MLCKLHSCPSTARDDTKREQSHSPHLVRLGFSFAVAFNISFAFVLWNIFCNRNLKRPMFRGSASIRGDMLLSTNIPPKLSIIIVISGM